MISLSQMMIRFLAALVLGALMGAEREFIGKEAGIRTTMLVSGGAAIFTIAALLLPGILTNNPDSMEKVIFGNAGFLNIIANIVVGIGFLGAGIIIKTQGHVHGLTTAALVWTAAAIGTLCGLGVIQFATICAIILTILLYLLRGLSIYDLVHKPTERKDQI